MIKIYRIPLVLLLFLAGCAGTQGPREASPGSEAAETPESAGTEVSEARPLSGEGAVYTPVPEGLRFVADSLPVLAITQETGLLSDEYGKRLAYEARRTLTESFRDAYLDGLLAGLPLAGVLGGDQVHPWPAGVPACWVQNWRGDEERSNFWGLPSLILALRRFGSPDDPEIRTYIVSGPILDFYSTGQGRNYSNGVEGYGAALGPPFFWEGKTAQRFDYGFILAGPGGQGSFIPYEDAPSAVPPLTGAFSGGGAALQDRLRGAFGTALREERDRRVRFASPFDPYAGGPPLIPDGPVEYLDFGAEPWNLPFPRREIQVRGIYIQFFDQGRTAFILPDSPDLPFTVKTLAAPYLDALMTVPEETPVETASGFSSPLPGAETLKAGRGLHAAEPARDLLRGMSLYGVPLTSGMPGEADGRILRVQRFSGGWMIHDE